MKKINFLATDGVALNGIIYESKQNTKRILLAIHGLTSNCLKERDEIIGKRGWK